MSPGCTSATRTVEPGGGGRSQPKPRRADAASRRRAAATTRRGAQQDRADDRGVDRDDQKAGQPHAAERGRGQRRRLVPLRRAQQRPRPAESSHDRTASASTHALGSTTTAASMRRRREFPDSSRCAAQPHGSHSAPSPSAAPPAAGPRSATASTGWPARSRPCRPTPAPRPPPRSARRAPPTATGPARPRPATTTTGRERRGRAARRRSTPPRGPEPSSGADALAILAIASSSVALNSSSLCCAVSPSVSAREKLAMTPLLRASFSHASSRL